VMAATPAGDPRVVIVGGGFGGLYAARGLRTATAAVTVIDRANHHLFQPLLYQVATAVLAPSDIASPLRWLLRRQRNTTVLLAEATSVDPVKRVVHLDRSEDVPYDYLLLATGARHSYFGKPEWEALAPGLKSLDDAREMRRRFLLAFEEAERTDDPEERRAALTFVIVGGGPTGVELAGMLPEVARYSMRNDFRRFDISKTRVLLLEGGPRLLPTYPEELSARAKRDLEQLGVEVRTSSYVTGIEPDHVCIGSERIPTRTIFWAAGNQASPLGRSLGAPLDRAGRVLVEPDLSVPGHPEIFVCGDLAAMKNADGSWVPAVAPAALQMGECAARNVTRILAGDPTQPFHYVNKGDLATIGRHRAVASIAGLKIAGPIAWFIWLFVHILYLAGFRNRMLVLLEWAFAYFTYERGARILTDRDWEGRGWLREKPEKARSP